MRICLEDGMTRIRELMEAHRHLDAEGQTWLRRVECAYFGHEDNELFELLSEGAPAVSERDGELAGTMIGVMNELHPDPGYWLSPRTSRCKRGNDREGRPALP